MFCDLVDSTELSVALDPEEMREVNRAYQEAVTTEVQRYGGFVARYMGDGVLAYFGWPRAHEDDPERSVRAGLEIVEAVRSAGVERGQDLRVRVGIATGRVVVGDLVGSGAAQEAAVVGETPNLAARLQSLAAPDTVLVSAATRRRLGGAFVAESMGLKPIKGMSEPVEVFLVTGLAEYVEADLTPLVGRSSELAWLSQAWDRVGDGGRVALVEGDAGIGKSHLVSAFCRDRRHLILRGSSLHRSTALYPLLRWAEGDREWVGPNTSDLLAWARGEVGAIDGAEPSQLARGLRDALLGEVEALAHTPLMVWVDDAHWIDPSSLAWLDALVERLASLPILVVVTYRPTFSPPWSSRAVDHLRVPRVDIGCVRSMILGVTGGRELPAEVVDHIAAKTDGIPLFVEELTRALIDGGQLTDTPTGWILAAPLEEMAIPGTLQDSLMARLDQLGSAKRVAQVAAVIGRQFSIEVLEVVGELDPAAASQALDRLRRARVIESSGALHTFRHALLQDTAYDSLLRVRRRDLHGRIAAFLESSGEPEPASVAYHVRESGDPIGAASWWIRSAEIKAGLYAIREAIADLERALRPLPELEPVPVNCILDLQIRIVRQFRVVQTTGAMVLLDQAEALAAAHGRKEWLSRVWFERGNALFGRFDLDGCVAAHRRALELAHELGSARLQADALGGLGDAWYLRGHMGAARDAFRACVALSEQHGFEETEVKHQMMVAWCNMFFNDFDQSLGLSERMWDRAGALGLHRSRMIMRGANAFIHAELGDGPRSEACAMEALELANKLESPPFQGSAKFYLFRACRLQGRMEEARDWGLLALNEARATNQMKFMGAAILAELARIEPDPAARAAWLAEGRQWLAVGSVGHAHLWFDVIGIQSCLDREEFDGALQHAEVLSDYTSEDRLPWCDLHIAIARAAAALAADAEGARDELVALQGEARAAGLRPVVDLVDRLLA